MRHVGERVPIQNSMEIRHERHPASNLSQTSEEESWRQASARLGVGRDPAQQKRRRRQTRRADHDVGLCGELLKIRRDLH
jgi:hypothetical protein